jgi:hypothetical protein
MKIFLKSASVILITTIIAAALIITSCGGSGGGGSENLGSDGSSGSGNVALLLADGPADDYDEIWISVTKVLLIPSNQNPSRSPVVIYETVEGHEVNLLDLRDEDFLLTIKKRVPAGWYSKIRLEVKEVWSEGGPCATFKLPSNKIDLNPSGDFEVRAKETLAIRLDIDADKSINLHKAGNSGKCIFRPVVFVDIDTIKTPQRCPQILVGEITELLPSEDNIEGFALELFDRRGTIDVWLSENPRRPTIIFDEDGFPIRRSALKPGEKVRVTGKINGDGDLDASVVVIGDVLSAKGTVVTSVNDDSLFPLLLDPGQELIGDQVNVEITNATFILVGCDEEVDPVAIQRGKRARVVGKFDVDDNVLRAAAVFLQSEEIVGDLVQIERATGGTDLIISDEDGSEFSVFLPQDTPVFLQGDGEISLGFLNQLLLNCGPKKVRIALDPEETEPTTREVRVFQERLFGRVTEILKDRTVRLRTGQLVRVQEGATILLNTKREDIPVDFDAIKIEDELTLYGLRACDDFDVDFFAYIVLINESTTDCDDDFSRGSNDDEDCIDYDFDENPGDIPDWDGQSMHPVDQAWLYEHGDYAEYNADNCTSCHGYDFRGAPSSGQVGCYDCHDGPSPDSDD